MAHPPKSAPSSSRPSAEEEAALRAMLKPRAKPYSSRSMGRNVVYTPADERALFRIMSDAFPGFFMLGRRRVGDERHWSIYDELGDFYEGGYGCVPDPDWNAESCIVDGGRKLRRFPHLFFRYVDPYFFDAPRGVGNFPSANWRAGSIDASYEPLDTEHVRFLRKVWRLMTKMTTNRIKFVDDDTGEVISPCTSRTWCGFDALRWCQQDPMRVLDYDCRPTDDWVMPDLPWYD